jgi:acyl-CoA oxidase
VGCYAQTELGHGSNVAGLETTATFDMKTDEFIVHTPTMTATKFWAGGLGVWANYAVVFAHLIVDENDFGVQPFLMQLRDLDTHEILPGIQIGDLGPKMGYNSKDNGYMIFNQVRIPRENHLCRLSGIDREGNFSINGDLRAIYQIMVNIRM